MSRITGKFIKDYFKLEDKLSAKKLHKLIQKHDLTGRVLAVGGDSVEIVEFWVGTQDMLTMSFGVDDSSLTLNWNGEHLILLAKGKSGFDLKLPTFPYMLKAKVLVNEGYLESSQGLLTTLTGYRKVGRSVLFTTIPKLVAS